MHVDDEEVHAASLSADYFQAGVLKRGLRDIPSKPAVVCSALSNVFHMQRDLHDCFLSCCAHPLLGGSFLHSSLI